MAIEISVEDIIKAKAYMPISIKEARARVLAMMCVERVDIPNDGILPMPPMWQENRMLRHQFLMGTLVSFYLGRELQKQKVVFNTEHGKSKEVELDYLMDTDQYNEYAESHIMNQLERLKKNKEVGNKVYDICYDFKMFENMLLGAIKDKVEQLNEPCGRLMQMIQMQTTPETVENALNELNSLNEQLQKEQQEKGKDNG